MKKVILLSILALSLNVCFAQTSGSATAGKGSSKFSIGVEAALPVGAFGTTYKLGIGGSLKYETPVIVPNLFLTLSAGYTNFTYKQAYQFPGISNSFGYIPLKAGGKYYFVKPNNGFFAEGQIGVVIGTRSGSGTAFAVSPGVGYTFGSGFEAGARFEDWSKTGSIQQLALRLAYRF